MAAASSAKGLIGGILFGLLFAGLGIWTLVDPSHASEMGHSETGRAKSRAFKAVMGWLFDTIGVIPTGIILTLIGLVIIGLTIRGAMSRGSATTAAPQPGGSGSV